MGKPVCWLLDNPIVIVSDRVTHLAYAVRK